MGKILVIAEKPSVASDYAKALNQYNPKDGFYEGDKYIITWAIGHIISRKELYEYDSNINRASQNREHVLKTLPFFPEEHVLKLAIIDTNRFKGNKDKIACAKRNNDGLIKREEVIKKLFLRTDIDFVVNACDAGREGEAIFGQIYDYYKCTFPVKRVWLSSSVAKDIVEGFASLRDGCDYYNLKQAAYARAEMDWEHGLNLSALYSSLYGAQLSVGRVQTPLVNMIVEREREISGFKSEDYYLLDAMLSTQDNFKYKAKLIIDSTLESIAEDGKIKKIADINTIKNQIENKQGVVKSLEKKKKKESPKLLYSLTELAKEMSAKHRMPAAEVLAIAQSLYETHKLTTYPRTSSQYLNESMRDDAIKRLDCLPADYDKAVEYAKNSECIYNKVFNDSKVEDHYAIIPTVVGKKYDLSKLSKKELIVYTAIVKRFISIFMPMHEYESTVLISEVEGYKFKTTGKKVLQMGWKSLYNAPEDNNADENSDDSQDLTYNFIENTPILCDEARINAKKTQAPKRFTDGTLLAAMEVGGVKNTEIADQDVFDLLKQKGLGTDATRPGLIENIINRGYVIRDKKSYFSPTDKGIDFIDRVSVDMLKSPEITGEWEYKLRLVEKGQLDKSSLIATIREFIRECVVKVKESYKEGDRISNGNTIDAKCPICGGAIIKSPKAYFCENNNTCRFVLGVKICGKTLKDKDVVDICSKGSTKLLKGFSNPNKLDSNGKPLKFDAMLIYDKSDCRLKFSSGASKKKERKETELICPKCGSHLVEFDTGYGCSGFKDGCKFSIFKKFFSKELSESDVKKLLENGETDVFEGLHYLNNPNKVFSAKLVLGEDLPETIYMDENNQPDTGKASPYFCPCCGKSILEFSRFYKCSKCTFAINKVIASVTLTENDIRGICCDKSTPGYAEFKSNKGNLFKAKLIVDVKNRKLQFQLYTNASEYICPLCNSSIGEGENNYKCTNIKCGLTVWKTIGKTTLDKSTIEEILTKKQTADYLELVSSGDKNYKAKLIINAKTKKLEFFFPPKEQ